MIKHLIIIGLLFCISCKKPDEEKKVIIKGKIATNVLGQEKDTLSIADARQILVFSGLNEQQNGLVYSLVDINEGSFSASSEMGKATALVFLDGSQKYIGSLCTQGLNMLPLGNLADGENTVIDLEALTMVDGIIVPSHDPLGNEIIITPEEINSLKEIDGYFESLSKNLDTDNDGILDFLSNKQTFIRTNYHIYAGHWGINGTPAIFNDSAINSISSDMCIYCNGSYSEPDSLLLTGPADSPYTDITMRYTGYCSAVGFEAGFQRLLNTPNGQIGQGFKKGIYTLTVNGTTNFTFSFSNINANNLMIVVPTLHTNPEGKLTSISLEYRLPDHSVVSHPENILDKLTVQLTDTVNGQFHELYMIPWMSNKEGGPGIYTHTLPNPLDISALHHAEVIYSDILGNGYWINWK